ncbi:MAG: hypothetical protein ABIH01_05095 [Candidatus Omnitrophota bacterium]
MKNLDLIRNRYLKDPLPVRLGNLAANLARIASFSGSGKNREAIKSLMEESKFFIEWTANEASPEIQASLVELQVKLALREHSLAKPSFAISQLCEESQAWSDEVLQSSGLI